jgi:hypothetical protein
MAQTPVPVLLDLKMSRDLENRKPMVKLDTKPPAGLA